MCSLYSKRFGTCVLCIFLFADTSLAAVSGDELTAAGKFVDSQAAAVGTAPALWPCWCSYCSELILSIGEHWLSAFGFVALSGNQRSTESSHDTGDIRADSLAVGDASQSFAVQRHCRKYRPGLRCVCRVQRHQKL